MRFDEVAEGVYRLGTPLWANFYLVVEDREAILIDSGYPRYWPQVEEALAALSMPLGALTAALITHHHVDHAGTAEQARALAQARVFVHEDDASRVRGEDASHPPPGFYTQAWRVSMIRYLVHTVRAGGAKYRPVAQVENLREDEVLDLPGNPRVVHTPGHTAGHCSLSLEERGVLLCGDALVNFDYASGEQRLGLHRFNEDRDGALWSLLRLEGLDPKVVLFGHGEPWTGGLDEALAIARNPEP